MGFYIIPVLTELASRVDAFAMVSWGSFTSGFLPRQLWGVLAILARLKSILFAMARFLAFHSPLRVGGEWPLVLSDLCSPLRVDGEWFLMLSDLCSPLAHLLLAMASYLFHFFFLCFPSLLGVLGSIPAQRDKVGNLKCKREIIHFSLGFSLNNLWTK